MSLSILSIECILANLEVNKRIQLSMGYPSIRNIEKSISIKLEKLNFTPSRIIINDTVYIFGEIVEIPEGSVIDEEEKMEIDTKNRAGGFEWRSLKDDVVDSGDVEFPFVDCGFLESQRFEVMEEVRRLFMESLENLLRGKAHLNPMKLFNNRRRIDKDMWYDEFLEVMLKIGGPSNFALRKITFLKQLFEIRKCGPRCEDDKLAEKYGRAYDLMMKRQTDMAKVFSGFRQSVLKKLVFPHSAFPTFNQFTIMDQSKNNIQNLQRLPENLSLRDAFKKLTTVIFGGRRNLQVENFEIDGPGIVGLPENFKVETETMRFTGFDKKWLLDVHGRILMNKTCISIAAAENPELFENEMIRNCPQI